MTMTMNVPLLVLATTALSAHAFSATANNNLAVYWGQNSFGATDPSDPSAGQKNLSAYCQDDVIDIIPLAFVDTFFSAGGLPSVNFANVCNPSDFPVFGDSQLPNCTFMEEDIKACQAAGKKLMLSLGGATGSNAFTSDVQASAFAQQIWDIFLGGSNASAPRPFGATPLDGVDLDIEGGGTTYFASFVGTLRALAGQGPDPTSNSTKATRDIVLRTVSDSGPTGAGKPYYISAAPQCPYPDAYMGTVLNEAHFDFVWVQFYNNACGVGEFPDDWDFDQWQQWATTVSINPSVRVYIGTPASPSAANADSYVDAAALGAIVRATAGNYSNFGGVMMWDASQAYANDRYDKQVKDTLKALPPNANESTTATSTSTSASTTSLSTSTTSSESPIPTSDASPSTTINGTVTGGAVPSASSSSIFSKQGQVWFLPPPA